MRIYLAAPWVRKHEAEMAAVVIESAGHTLTKRWWEHREVPGYGGTRECAQADREELQQQAYEDWKGVETADAMIVLNLEKSEGKAVEQGFALAYGVRLIVVGDSLLNLFQYLPGVDRVDTVEQALALLALG
jgi:nucleoside 2-deoxyribosyltransferase